ncbi:hypothetical protein GCM10011521_22340 [Arenimonas soli]|uniref:RDD domain-containing protein n=1 Tax=Arenimonas soli TaxID=2269504 RepID=A0ABQ1HMQ1_9GAMM|nr:RDD family protein [Arenimonas soli]GGA83493.1 hypothetical protein GCM10011521_22340 [Arenimonas soli]
MTDSDHPYPDSAVPALNAAPAFAGFWRRLGAFFIDGLVLGLFGLLVGLAIGDVLAGMGGYERFVGFAIALAFGLLNSRLTGGRTPGKYLLGIRVADLSGAPISIPRALLRQAVLSLPFFLNGAPFDEQTLFSFFGVVLSVLLFGGMFAIVYLFVFNRKSRRSLHDLVAGTCVVRSVPPGGVPPVAPIWRGHLVVVGLVALFSAAAPFLGQKLAGTPTFEALLEANEALGAQPDVVRSFISTNINLDGAPVFGGYVSVTLVIDNKRVANEKRALEIGRLVLEEYPPAREKQVILITFVHGYDMVIASSHRSQTYRFKPEEL